MYHVLYTFLFLYPIAAVVVLPMDYAFNTFPLVARFRVLAPPTQCAPLFLCPLVSLVMLHNWLFLLPLVFFVVFLNWLFFCTL